MLTDILSMGDRCDPMARTLLARTDNLAVEGT
jgi:hypothetical protein